MRTRYPGIDAVLARAAGTITYQWYELVAFECTPADNGAKILWNDEAVSPAQMEVDLLRADLQAITDACNAQRRRRQG